MTRDTEWGAILALAEQQPDGPGKIALCESAVALADAAGDRVAQFDTRVELTTAASFGGAPEVTLVAFAWLLAAFDAGPPDAYNEFRILWRYKWVLGAVANFPDYPLGQCEGLLADLARRFAAAGEGRYAATHCEYRLARSFGDDARAAELAARLRRLRPGRLADCEACRVNDRVKFLAALGHDGRALRAAAPLLDGRLRCHAVPRGTYATLLMPLWRQDRLAEAMEMHRVGYNRVAAVPSCYDDHAWHAEFLTLTGNLPRAARLVSKHLPAALESRSPSDKLVAITSFRVALHALRDAGTKTLALKLPPGHALHRETGRAAVAEIADAVDTEARDLARRFDTRNGNAAHTDALASSLLLKPKPFPYSAKG